MQLAGPPRSRAGKPLRCLRSTCLSARSSLPCRAPCGGVKRFARAFGWGRGFAPPLVDRALGRPASPGCGRCRSRRQCPAPRRLPPRPSRCRAPAGSGWTPEPPLRGSPASRLVATCSNPSWVRLVFAACASLRAFADDSTPPEMRCLPLGVANAIQRVSGHPSMAYKG